VKPECEVFVVGAGPAGLTAAYLLTKAGRAVTTIERDPHYVGGISRTVNYKGYLFDIGGHRFFSKSKQVVDLWREILPDDFIQRPRLSRIYYKDKFFAYPLWAAEAFWKLGPIESFMCMGSWMYARVFPIKNPKTFHQWVRNQFGERLFSIFFKTYTEKVWGMSCDEISADWAAQRIKGLDLYRAIINGFGRSFRFIRGKGYRKDRSSGVKTLLESFDYPSHGPGMMWEAAAKKVRAQGGKILQGCELTSLAWNEADKIWTVSYTSEDGSVNTTSARHVISSAPIPQLMDSIAPKPTSVSSAKELKYRDFITVALIAKANDSFPDNWIYIHDPSVNVGRVQNFASWSPSLVPDPENTCLGLEYFCFEGDGLWTSSDADLIAMATREISKIGLLKPDEIIDACVVRQQKAYPVYDEDYQTHVDAVRADIRENYPTLHLVGRNGMHKYNNQDHAMMTAMLTVKNILSGELTHDIWSVNEDAEYHEADDSAQKALKSERLVPRRVLAR
jgi:protoporphyrinogen oxidase